MQLVSVRDIRQSAIDSSFSSLQHQNRLLRFILTDGLSETVAIEYTAIPGILEEIIPGFSIPTISRYCDARPEARSTPVDVKPVSSTTKPEEKTSSSAGSLGLKKVYLCTTMTQFIHLFSPRHIITKCFLAPATQVIEAVPVQNQAAAQKLLQKMSQPMPQGRNPRDHRTRFKGRQEEAPVFTLDEWERKKAGTSSAIRAADIQDTSADEILARQLQSQLDFEDPSASNAQSFAVLRALGKSRFRGRDFSNFVTGLSELFLVGRTRPYNDKGFDRGELIREGPP
ncbi:hypothetical protein KSP40_PGU022500 [Platanthera guangdongensis]|uniref:Uncharacterized protein n=1 Tax=Platanthera guangdongensis TaxID=2320717 RepID=A0ABR2LEV5_9ASPA